jgi:cytochrome c553
MLRISFLGAVLLLFSISCKEKKPMEKVVKTDADGLVTVSTLQGKKLMEQKCYLCHSPTAPQKQGRVGPPMIAVKAHYQQEFSERQVFIDSMVAFVLEPIQHRVKLKGAARRFGLMPKASYNEEEIEKIAAYLYDHQIQEPEWFEEHWYSRGFKPYTNKEQQQVLTEEEKPTYAEMGSTYALGAKKVLGANLMGSIQKEGVAAALAFCNERAYPITDSMSVAYNANIRRVSDKPRNPNNRANQKELERIQTFKQAVLDKEKIQPIVEDLGDKVHFYAPILTNQMCLKCHGDTKSDVSLEVKHLLAEKYPSDKATGYGINEVRGIWSITFEKQKNVKF